MSRYRHLLIFPLISLLLSCTAVPPKAADISRAEPVPEASHPPAESELDAPTLYDVLLGEIAAQRGRMDVAVDALSRAAEHTRDPRLAERAALAALYAKQYESAHEAARLWTDLQPESMEAREVLATALLELKRTDEAERELVRMLETAQTDGSVDHAYLRIAAVLGRAGPRDAALGTMERLVQRYPNVAAGHYAAANLAVRTGDLDAAGAAIDRALTLRPDWEDAALFKARILVSQKNFRQAQDFFEEFLNKYPKSTDVRLHYARYLIDRKQWEQARVQFKRIVEETPSDADSIFAIALLALQTNRVEEAETYLKRVLVLRPENEQAHIYLGQVAEQRRHYAEAERWYGQVQPGEYYLEARSRLAIVVGKQGNVERARMLLHAVPTTTDQQRVQLILAEEQVLRDAKQFREALAMLNAALKHIPADKDLLYARALIAERLDKLNLMESDLRAILSRDPNNANALNALGYTLADRTDRYAEAEVLLKRALEQKPGDPFILDSIGWLHYRRGDNTEALKYLKRALSIRGDAEIAAHLGEVLWVVGDHNEAESVWTRALHDTPDNEALRDVIKKYKP